MFGTRDAAGVASKMLKSAPDSLRGSFTWYVTLEGVGGYMPKRYKVLRGGGGLRQRYVTLSAT